MRVVIGLSGGVDSSVAAHLLMEQGHEVIALFMRNWNDESVTINNECPWIDDANDAMLVANHLGIPFQVMDLSTEYKERIVDYMFDEYAAGRTPNPDVLCNREVKFDLFLDAALKLGADAVATGHYCSKSGPTRMDTIICWQGWTATRTRAISSVSSIKTNWRGRCSPSASWRNPRFGNRHRHWIAHG